MFSLWKTWNYPVLIYKFEQVVISLEWLSSEASEVNFWKEVKLVKQAYFLWKWFFDLYVSWGKFSKFQRFQNFVRIILLLTAFLMLFKTSIVTKLWYFTRILQAVVERCSVKKLLLEISQNSQEVCEFCEISTNTFLHRTPLVVASGIY